MKTIRSTNKNTRTTKTDSNVFEGKTGTTSNETKEGDNTKTMNFTCPYPFLTLRILCSKSKHWFFRTSKTVEVECTQSNEYDKHPDIFIQVSAILSLCQCNLSLKPNTVHDI